MGWGSSKSVLFMCSFRREKKNRSNVVAYNDWTDEAMTGIPVRLTWESSAVVDRWLALVSIFQNDVTSYTPRSDATSDFGN